MFITLLPNDAKIIAEIAKFLQNYFLDPKTTPRAIARVQQILTEIYSEYARWEFFAGRYNPWSAHVEKINIAKAKLLQVEQCADIEVAAQDALQILIDFLSKSSNWKTGSLNHRVISNLLTDSEIHDFSTALNFGGENLRAQLEIVWRAAIQSPPPPVVFSIQPPNPIIDDASTPSPRASSEAISSLLPPRSPIAAILAAILADEDEEVPDRAISRMSAGL